MRLKICLIGAGDIEYHYFNLLKIKKEDFEKEIEEIGKVLAKTECEILLLPDRGVSLEVAKKYKEYGGRKVIGTIPYSDKEFGIEHLKTYIETKVRGNALFDEFIDTNNWYKQDLIHCILGDVILMLGISLGSMGELVYGYYLYKLFEGKKPEVKAKRDIIHPETLAGKRISYSTIIYKPFIKDKLPYEIEKYIEKFKGRLYYVNDSKELMYVLKKLKNL